MLMTLALNKDEDVDVDNGQQGFFAWGAAGRRETDTDSDLRKENCCLLAGGDLRVGETTGRPVTLRTRTSLGPEEQAFLKCYLRRLNLRCMDRVLQGLLALALWNMQGLVF
jgi:hypothetical protein